LLFGYDIILPLPLNNKTVNVHLPASWRSLFAASNKERGEGVYTRFHRTPKQFYLAATDAFSSLANKERGWKGGVMEIDNIQKCENELQFKLIKSNLDWIYLHFN